MVAAAVNREESDELQIANLKIIYFLIYKNMDREIYKPKLTKENILKQIEEVQATIKELEPLEIKYPHLLNLSYDDGLNPEEYHALQQQKALKFCRKELISLEKRLEQL
ncbi:MAG: hypothetical protein AAB732_02130 [Patescibacteria group bacterium]